jgi:nucleotide-binding universal stress UspA family protein
MKTIIAPTDFSEVSANSIEYAAEIAKLFNARLILFHAYHPPVVASEVPVIIPTLEEIEKDSVKLLKEIEVKLHQKFGPTLKIESVCQCGFAAKEIDHYALQNKADLIVMGMLGAGYLSEKIIGSVTTTVISGTECPVLAIDKNVKFKSIKKIMLAADFKQVKQSKLNPLKQFASFFKAHVYILNVVKELETIPSSEEALAGLHLEHSFEGIDHSFCIAQNVNLIDGINEFVKDKNMDLVVMIPRKHSLFASIFKERNTKQMAFHASVPLLTIHE